METALHVSITSIRLAQEVRRIRWRQVARRNQLPVRKGSRLFHWLAESGAKGARVSVVAAVLLVGRCLPARAAFQSAYINPHATAMGGSSLAGVQDSASIFLNPANVSGLRGPEFYFMYTQAYAGLKGVGSIGQGLVSAGAPTRFGSIGIGFGDFRAEGLLEERVISLSFARPLTERIHAGVAAKYMYHNYLIGSDPLAQADPVFARGSSRGAASFDAGMVAALIEPLTVGLMVRNINSPDVGLASEDRVPREYAAALAYEFKSMGLRVTTDAAFRDTRSGTFRDRFTPSIGAEKSLAGDMVKFRVGGSPQQVTGGVGLQFGQFGFDYAFSLKLGLLADNAGSHLVGIRYRFGSSASTQARGMALPAQDGLSMSSSIKEGDHL
ncbi:MAG: hypothetical protein HY078_00560 [Elusimicrobia bacterium]|nr:hypothetical protein [Elusimicrobiota bacterium]